MIVLKMILVLLLALIAVLVARTLMLKPTSAQTAKVQLDTSQRAVEYGKGLSRMIQKETVSSRFDSDKTKFYEFHQLLEEMFPHLHRNCEKKVFNGSLLFK